MAETTHFEYYSNHLSRNIKVEVTGSWGYPILMFPSSGGEYTQNRDFLLNDSIMHLVDIGKVKLYNVETIDMLSFYDDNLPTDVKIHNYDLYMKFIQTEFIPYIQNECNVHRVAVAGVSFGGYHAANTAFRFPDLVSHLFAMSATFNVRTMTQGSDDMRIYFNCPNEFMPGEETWKYKHMHIVLSTSDWDICLGRNQEMSAILNAKGIDHWYDEKQWISHDWLLWRMVFREYVGTYFN